MFNAKISDLSNLQNTELICFPYTKWMLSDFAGHQWQGMVNESINKSMKYNKGKVSSAPTPPFMSRQPNENKIVSFSSLSLKKAAQSESYH